MAFDIAQLLSLFAASRANQGAGNVNPADLLKGLNAPSAAEQARLDYQQGQLPSTSPGSKSPFDTGFFKNGASQLTPEARLASQGNNANNMWAQLGGNSEVDPSKLERMNSQVAGMRKPVGPLPDRAATASGASQSVPSTFFPQGFKAPTPLMPKGGGNPNQEAANLQMNMDMGLPGFWAALLGTRRAM